MLGEEITAVFITNFQRLISDESHSNWTLKRQHLRMMENCVYTAFSSSLIKFILSRKPISYSLLKDVAIYIFECFEFYAVAGNACLA